MKARFSSQNPNSDSDLQFEDDEMYDSFKVRKELILSNMTELIEAKYPVFEQRQKHDTILGTVMEALDEEDNIFRDRAMTIQRESIYLNVNRISQATAQTGQSVGTLKDSQQVSFDNTKSAVTSSHDVNNTN